MEWKRAEEKEVVVLRKEGWSIHLHTHTNEAGDVGKTKCGILRNTRILVEPMYPDHPKENYCDTCFPEDK